MKTKKEIALEFLKLCSDGHSRKAFGLYAAPEFKHHNAFFKGDPESLITAMEEAAKQNPDKTFTILRALEDGDLVAVHTRFQQNQDDSGHAIVHILKFKANKIEELWDFGQAVPEDMINENGMF